MIPELSAAKTKVKVRPLDDILRSLSISTVDFIKVWTLKCLSAKRSKGSLHPGVFQNPVMLDSYHRSDDAVVLPRIIREANPAYREFCAVCSPDRQDTTDRRIVPYAIFFE